MTLPRVRVRPADERDVPRLVALWEAAVAEAPVAAEPLARATATDRTADRVRRVVARPGVTVLLAVAVEPATGEATTRDAVTREPTTGEPVTRDAGADDRLLGAAVLVDDPLAGVLRDDGPTVEALYVVPGARGRGVGAALLARAATLAEGTGATRLAVAAPTAMRPASRYYARMGFGAPVTRRVAPTAALLRRVAPHRAGVVDVVSRRRSLRARLVGDGAGPLAQRAVG